MQAPVATDTAAQTQATSGAPSAALVAAIGAAAAALVLTLVPRFEGTVLRGYRDIGGVVTACTGHTRHALLGRHYTAAECAAFLASDLVQHTQDLRCIQRPLQPHETAALLSLAFNVGPGKAGVKDGLCELKRGGPSTIVRRANAGDMAGACASISEWTFVGERNCALADNALWCGGIIKRRAAERAMCEGRYMGGPLPPQAAASQPAAAGTP